MQRWADEYGNICFRAIPRPALASEYFSKSPRVDNHNQSRQHDLALEELWQTQDCWFRLWTTFMGIHLVDCWKLCRFHLPSSHQLATGSVVDFSDKLAAALLKNSLPHDIDRRTVTPRRILPAKRVMADIGNPPSRGQHRRGQYPRVRVGKHMKTKQSRCKLCQAEKKESYTSFFCRDCGIPLCVASNRHERDCWTQHVESSLDELHRSAVLNSICTPDLAHSRATPTTHGS